ncbi:hypothetical protein [Streptomyces sp. AS02]|uniref:hypothetical protein n=1 Tax=Streptomyces sp. AS02 TaxID=2938946 RepID=UPI002020CEA2|nr:hypothetical protein [Streptomyces sp. AS02]MCL8016932.1 hypothetical protein [Streptomyces sp. AS02]
MPPTPERPLTPHEKLAARLEGAFARHCRSLTDEATAQDFLITLDEVRITLHGALETGLLTRDQHDTLDAMFEAMQQAPGLLTG